MRTSNGRGSLSGFFDDEHRRNFEVARTRTRLGGVDQERCGAKVGEGRTCQRLPVAGLGRCQQHLGRRSSIFRERQREAFEKGELSPIAWRAAETRRAANRIRIAWRRDRWTPGRTLDLGRHEDEFRASLAAFGFDLRNMAPSTLDAIRWRYRRFVIDRDRLDDWHNFVLQRLRIMVDADGPVPTGHDARLSDGSPAAFTVDEDPSPYSKRRRPDKKVSTKTRRGVGRVPGQGQRTRRGSAARGAPETRQELLEHLSRYWADVRGVAAPFQDDEDTLLRIARAHRAKVDHPDDPAVWPEWLGLLAELQTTGRGY